METEVLDEKTGELVEIEKRDKSLVFGTVNPERIIENATVVANRLNDIVEQKKLFHVISGRKYVKVEGWNAVIAMLGVFPTAVYCNKLDRKEGEIAYEARVSLKHFSGTTVGEGQGFCSSLERNWKGRDEFAIKSMAQTRALGKACRLSFGWIMALAGYESTPLEEMDGIAPNGVKPQIPPKNAVSVASDTMLEPTPEMIDNGEEVFVEEVTEAIEFPEPAPHVKQALEAGWISVKQASLLYVKGKQAKIPDKIMAAHLKQTYGIDHSSHLPRAAMQEVLDWIERYKAVAEAKA